MDSFFSQLGRQSVERANSLAVIGNRYRLSFASLLALVEKYSRDLRECGIGHDSIVGLTFADPVRHLVASLALLNLRATQVAIGPHEVLPIRRTLAERSGINAKITDTAVSEDGGAYPTILISSDWKLNASPAPGNTPSEPAENPLVHTRPAMIFLGSGTTGVPKLIAPSFELFASLIARDLSVRPMRPGERHYCMSSLDYYTAKRRTIGCLSAGVTVLLPTSMPRKVLDFCRMAWVDHLSLTTTQAAMLVSEAARLKDSRRPAMPRLKSMFVGSSPLGEPLRKAIRSLVSGKLQVVYGSNEFGEATVAAPDDLDAHPGTVGRPCPGVTIDIVDRDGKRCSPGQTGLIRLRSSPMMNSYPGAPVESSLAFRSDGYYPGDMGRLTQDGNLIFAGRLDDLMIFSGVNIYPRTIEDVLEAHPRVREAAAFPIEHKGLDQTPYAVVVAEGVGETELLEHCRQHLGWRSPIRIFHVTSLPRNAAGKVLKRVLASAVAEKMRADTDSRKPSKAPGS